MLIPSETVETETLRASLSRRVNANSQLAHGRVTELGKLIKKGEC